MTAATKAMSVLAEEDWKLLERFCRGAEVPPEVVAEMLLIENKVYGMGRRPFVHEKLDELINEWARGVAEKGGER